MAEIDQTQDFEKAAIEKRKQRRQRRGRTRKVIYGVWALLLLAFVYIGVQVVLVLTPNIRTEIAILETMTDSVFAQSFVTLESEPVTYDGGILYFTVDSGERVSSGTAVAELYGSESAAASRARLAQINEEIDRLEVAARTSAVSGDTENFLRQMQAGVVGLMDAVDSRDYTGITGPLGEVVLAGNKLQLATGAATGYDTRLQLLLSQQTAAGAAAASQGEVVAHTTGFFVHASGRDRVPMAYDALAGADVNTLLAYLDAEPDYYDSNVAGYIITDYKWSLFALVPAAQADRFTQGDKSLSISFAELGTGQLPVTVQSVQMEDGDEYAKVELYCEQIGPEILRMQSQTVEIIFSVQNGLRITKDALRIQNGEYGVYIVFGSVVYFRRVEILLEDEHYMLVPSTTAHTVNEVLLYDEVIIDSGGVELFDGKIL